MPSSAVEHCLIWLSLCCFIAAALAAAPAAACFFMSSIFSSRALFSATASQAPTLRPVMFIWKSPCLPPLLVMVLLNSVRAALVNCCSMVIVLPSGQLRTTVVPSAVFFVPVTLQSFLLGSCVAAREGSSPWQTRCGFIIPAGMPGMFIVISHSSPLPLPCAAAASGRASNTAPTRPVLISNLPWKCECTLGPDERPGDRREPAARGGAGGRARGAPARRILRRARQLARARPRPRQPGARRAGAAPGERVPSQPAPAGARHRPVADRPAAVPARRRRPGAAGRRQERRQPGAVRGRAAAQPRADP